MSEDKKSCKPVPYKSNLPNLNPPRMEELADLIMRMIEINRKINDELEKLSDAPKHVQ